MKISEAIQNTLKQIHRSAGAFLSGVFIPSLERRRNEMELYDRQSQLLVDHLPDPVFIFDTNGNILHANPASLEKFGYKADEIEGCSG